MTDKIEEAWFVKYLATIIQTLPNVNLVEISSPDKPRIPPILSANWLSGKNCYCLIHSTKKVVSLIEVIADQPKSIEAMAHFLLNGWRYPLGDSAYAVTRLEDLNEPVISATAAASRLFHELPKPLEETSRLIKSTSINFRVTEEEPDQLSALLMYSLGNSIVYWEPCEGFSGIDVVANDLIDGKLFIGFSNHYSDRIEEYKTRLGEEWKDLGFDKTLDTHILERLCLKRKKK